MIISFGGKSRCGAVAGRSVLIPGQGYRPLFVPKNWHWLVDHPRNYWHQAAGPKRPVWPAGVIIVLCPGFLVTMFILEFQRLLWDKDLILTGFKEFFNTKSTNSPENICWSPLKNLVCWFWTQLVSTVDTCSEFYTVARPFLFLYFVRGFGVVNKSLKVVNAKASLILYQFILIHWTCCPTSAEQSVYHFIKKLHASSSSNRILAIKYKTGLLTHFVHISSKL